MVIFRNLKPNYIPFKVLSKRKLLRENWKLTYKLIKINTDSKTGASCVQFTDIMLHNFWDLKFKCKFMSPPAVFPSFKYATLILLATSHPVCAWTLSEPLPVYGLTEGTNKIGLTISTLTNAVRRVPPICCLTNVWVLYGDWNMNPTHHPSIQKPDVFPGFVWACIHKQPFAEAFMYTHTHINPHLKYWLHKISWLSDITLQFCPDRL